MKLAVVIAARNEIRFLPEQLSALEAETWMGDWEVIVADNGSTDGTADFVETRAKRWPRLRLLRADERAGKPYAINAAIASSDADLFLFTDADDVVCAGWVAALAAALKEADVVTGPVDLDALNPPALADSRGRGGEDPVPWFEQIFPFVRGNNYGITRAALDRIGSLDETAFPTEDMEFSLRAQRAGIEVVGVPSARVAYRYRPAPRSLWRQGLSYGEGRCRIVRNLIDHGERRPSRLAGIRSWAWLVVNAPALLFPSRRAAWAWVAGNRCGQVRGSVRHRVVYL